MVELVLVPGTKMTKKISLYPYHIIVVIYLGVIHVTMCASTTGTRYACNFVDSATENYVESKE